MRGLRILIAAVVVLTAMPMMAQETWDKPLDPPVPYHIDSGLVSNATGFNTVVLEETVHIPSAAWLRLYFGDVQLGEGSFLRVTAELDGEVQELDAATLEMWSNTTAYFNGDTLKVELVAGPSTVNRLEINELAWEPAPETPFGGAGCDPGCCGPTDDRVPSNELWSNRLVPAGCSASIYNTDSCAVSAGHCASAGMVLQFNVPASDAVPCGGLNNPPVSEQFPVTNFQFTNGGVGNDWMAMTVGTNNLGERPFDRYGEFRPIVPGAPTVGTPATVWGYGVDNECTKSQTQQTSDGFIESLTGTGVRYSIDVTFGNSGSGVLENGTEIAGIVTHCCCPNWGTRTDHPAFVAARESLCPTAPAQAASLLSASVILGTPVSVSVADLVDADDDHAEIDSNTFGMRNSTLTEVVAQSPFGGNTVNQLNLFVEYGPVNGDPVFYLVQLFNNDSGLWDNLEFGILNTGSATNLEFNAVSTPNAYLNGTGEIKVRVGATARVPQTPSGFTKLIDQVLVTVKP